MVFIAVADESALSDTLPEHVMDEVLARLVTLFE